MLDLQKASMSKRISAFLFDFIVWVALAVGVGFFLSGILHYDVYVNKLNSSYDSYEQEYGIEFEMDRDEFIALSPEKQEQYNEAYEALTNDKETMKTYGVVVNLTLLIISLSILIAYLVTEFAVPVWLKNGQTMGKKIFGVAVMHTSGVQITPLLLFFRTVLGKYTLETMVPVLILILIFFGTLGLVGTIILGLLLLLQIVLAIATPTNSLLHDILAKTVVVDITSQKIFKDSAELLEYKKKLHAEEADRQSYF